MTRARLRGAAVVARAARQALVDRRRLLRSAIRPYRPMEGGQGRLDDEYEAGTWDYLAEVRELPRFGIVAGYCLERGAGGRILEIGCGEGLLAQRLGTDRLRGFVGVDISQTAVDRAARRGLPNASFVVADAATFVPEGRFDVIVFHEVLEYFDDPVSVVHRAAAWLGDDGRLIVSQYRSPDNARTRRIWRGLHRRLRVVAEASVTTGPRHTWTIEVLIPAGRS